MSARWKFETLDGAETYAFRINPNEHASFVPTRDVQWSHSRAGFTGTRAGRTPLPSSFSGVVRDEAQYDAFLAWLGKRQKIRMTTDLGQRFVVRLMAFKPRQEAKTRNRHAPWRFEYQMDILIFEELSVVND